MGAVCCLWAIRDQDVVVAVCLGRNAWDGIIEASALGRATCCFLGWGLLGFVDEVSARALSEREREFMHVCLWWRKRVCVCVCERTNRASISFRKSETIRAGEQASYVHISTSDRAGVCHPTALPPWPAITAINHTPASLFSRRHAFCPKGKRVIRLLASNVILKDKQINPGLFV